jgi:ABC-type lipoprotein export system ATPase subunit
MSTTTVSSPFIELRAVTKIFKTAAGEFTALRSIDLGFERGEFTAIIGKSGSGKSTLINMITGIDHPTAGAVRIGDTELYKMREGQMAEWRGRNLGIVFQFFQLLPTLNVLENTLLPMDYCNRYPAGERVGRALQILEMVSLDGLAHKLPAALSGGQQQIAAIARALANDPPIIIADEPTGNLDSRTAELVLNIFEKLASQGKTILMVTHDPTLVRRATRRVIISDGELVNEDIYHALSMLPHPHMLKLSKLVTPRAFPAGAAIARQGGVDNGLIIIRGGEVEVTRERVLRRPQVVTVLHRGDYVSELDMLELPLLGLSFRARTPVDTLCISLGAFGEFLNANPASEKALRQAAVHNVARYNPGGASRPGGRH